MDLIKKKLISTKRGLKEIHTKKPQIEFFTALLTIPVLLTVIILNINNLKGNSNNKAETEKPQTIVITQPSDSGSSNNSSNTGNANNEKKEEVVITKEVCEPGLGDISIATPEENTEVSDNPVNIEIEYDQNGYCAAVWSYRVNGGAWSSYDDTSISLFNLAPGNVKLDLRVKSLVNSDTKSLSRNFKYSGNITNSPTTTITPTPIP